MDWDVSDPGSVLVQVEEPREAYAPASAVDLLRQSIATDPARHGSWFQLSQYRPMPKRAALGIASAWRRANPARFDGDRHFEARIMPADVDGRGRRELVVTKHTLYAVAVRYPVASTQPAPSEHFEQEPVQEVGVEHQPVQEPGSNFGNPWIPQQSQ